VKLKLFLFELLYVHVGLLFGLIFLFLKNFSKLRM